jgi:hypothetical protein
LDIVAVVSPLDHEYDAIETGLLTVADPLAVPQEASTVETEREIAGGWLTVAEAVRVQPRASVTITV